MLFPCEFASNHLRLAAPAHFIAEHTLDFVAHGFFACRAEMGFDFVCGLAYALNEIGLFGFIGGYRLIDFISRIHNACPFRRICACSHKLQIYMMCQYALFSLSLRSVGL